MSTDDEAIRRRYQEFLQLLPLTINIAGLPTSQGPISYSAEQMEVRATTLSQAHRLAKQMARDAIRER